MMQLNEVKIVGNVVREPELRYTPKGTPVANISLGVNEKYSVDGEERNSVTFIDVSTFGKAAENLAKLVSKGTELFVEGSLRQENWTDKNTGQNRSKISITSSRWQFTQRLSNAVSQVPEQPAGVDR